MSIINIENVTKCYKTKKALNNVSLNINEGELFGLLGVNGAGKTTLIKILCLLSKKTSGSVVINGLDIENDAEKIKEIIGALTDSLNPISDGEYDEEFEGGFEAAYPTEENEAYWYFDENDELDLFIKGLEK